MEDIDNVFWGDFAVAAISDMGRKLMSPPHVYMDGSGCPEGNGSGCAMGYVDKWGEGIGYPYDIGLVRNLFPPTQVNGYKVRLIDEEVTIIISAHGDFAAGYILRNDFQLLPCYVAKKDGLYAHGDSLHDAYSSLLAKTEERYSVEERLAHFKDMFPEWDVPYNNRSLFDWHHVLTGSCRMGREQFCKAHGIDMDGQTAVREFVELAKNSYGGDIINSIPEMYF